MRIMVVDNSSVSRSLFHNILTRLNFNVMLKPTSIEAIEICRKDDSYDVIFLDLNMPDITGLEFLQLYNSLKSFAKAKVILTTSESNMVKVREGLRMGAAEYMLKPFSEEDIVTKLKNIGAYVYE